MKARNLANTLISLRSFVALAVCCLAVPASDLPGSPVGVAAAQSDLPAEPDQAANTLFTAALQAIEAAAETGDTEARLTLLRRAQDNLERIVEGYPASQLAVQLASGQRIGRFSPDDLAASLVDAEQAHRCTHSPDFCAFLDDALTTAEEIPNRGYRAEALVAIGRAQAQAGLLEQARQTFARAYLLPRLDIPWGIRISVIRAQADTGLFADAFGAVDRSEDDLERAWALATIAVAQTLGGLAQDGERTFRRSEQIADRLRGSQGHDLALYYIAVLQAERGQFAAALERAVEIPYEDLRAEALRSIAADQVAAGLVDDALATIESNPDNFERWRSLVAVAGSYAAAGRLAEAEATVERLPYRQLQWKALADLAVGQAAAGLTEEARRTFAEAIEIAQTPPLDVRPSVLSAIAAAQAAAGFFVEAFSTANGVAASDHRAAALAAIAQHHIAAGLEDQGRSTFADALDMAREILDDGARTRVLLAIATAQSDAALASLQPQ